MNLDSNTIMLIIVIANVFIMGILITVAIRHAYAHFKNQDKEQDAEKQTHRAPQVKNQAFHLPSKLRDKLILSSEAHFQTVINRSATTLERDLKATTSKLTKQMDKIGSDIILSEMKRYQSDLEAMRKTAEAIIEGAQRDIVSHQDELKIELAKKQTELEAALKQDIADEKQVLINHLNDSLSDAVVAFLSEAMKHEIDLGAQSQYLTKVLEDHKAELIKEIIDET